MLALKHKIIRNLKYIYIPFFSYQIGRNPKSGNILISRILQAGRQACTSLLGKACLHEALMWDKMAISSKFTKVWGAGGRIQR